MSPLAYGENNIKASAEKKSNIPFVRSNYMEKIDSRIVNIIVDILGVEESQVSLNAVFSRDLGADSLDAIEMVMAAEKEFNISIDDSEVVSTTTTVLEAILFIEKETGMTLHSSDRVITNTGGMTQLERDLRTLTDSALSKGDAEAAIRLVAEITGGVAVLGIAATVISAMFGPAGLVPVGAAACHLMFKKCGEAYANLSTEDRTLVRKLARGLKGVLES